jgi:hypothetical protein
MKAPKFKKLLFICFNLCFQHAFATDVRVPVYLQGVVEDSTHLSDHDYVYKVQGSLTQKPIKAQKQGQASIEDLISTLVFAYQQNDKSLFLSLHGQSARDFLQKLPPAQFEENWKAFSRVKNPVIDYYFDHGPGFVVAWRHDSSSRAEILFARKDNGNYQIEQLRATREDKRFTNLSFYFTYRPLEVQAPEILKMFKPGDKQLELELKTTLPLIYFLSKENASWSVKTYTKDNELEKFILEDQDPRTGYLKLQFAKEQFDPGKKHEILILESTFPLSSYPIQKKSSGQLKY